MKIYIGIIVFLFDFSSLKANTEKTAEKIGDFLQILLPSAALTSTFIEGYDEGGEEFIGSFLLNMGITHLLKHVIHEERPENNGWHSFPSGHTSVAFQAASFIHIRYGWKYGLPSYILATYVGWSRVNADKHWTIDALVGALIGYASSRIFTTPRRGIFLNSNTNSGLYSVGLKMEF